MFAGWGSIIPSFDAGVVWGCAGMAHHRFCDSVSDGVHARNPRNRLGCVLQAFVSMLGQIVHLIVTGFLNGRCERVASPSDCVRLAISPAISTARTYHSFLNFCSMFMTSCHNWHRVIARHCMCKGSGSLIVIPSTALVRAGSHVPFTVLDVPS